MKKKKKPTHRHRNAGPSSPAPTRAKRSGPTGPESSLQRLGYTVAGAAATALTGSFLAREGWAPKTIASVITAVGAGLAWRGDDPMIKSVGAGAMAAGGSQLALLLLNDVDNRPRPAALPPATMPQLPGKRQADALPPGALEAAFERARARIAMQTDDEHAHS
jgi:hypothetical protein